MCVCKKKRIGESGRWSSHTIAIFVLERHRHQKCVSGLTWKVKKKKKKKRDKEKEIRTKTEKASR